MKESLPIDAVLPNIKAELEERNTIVLEATPGAGKTTRVPQAVLQTQFLKGREILVLEPRRLAAKMAAYRVAEELGARVGELVGYQFRFENVGGPATRIRFLTEGMFLRRLLSDPRLERVGAVIVDEFHERHLQGDVALAALRRLQLGPRPDLRVVVMSATLDTKEISRYLGGAKIVSVETRRFEVAVEYLPLPELYLDRQVAAALKRFYDGEGDVLVFLPGVAEIRRAADALGALARERGFELHSLYGDLSREEQDRAVRQGARPKVILSTNVAETSLTIPGVKLVVDSGLAKIASYSWWSGLPALKTKNISRASAIQRAGRAGRLGPGRCVRLYTKESFDTRPPFETPELLRADLSQTLLELASLGVRDPKAFPWFEPPQAASLEAALRLLYRLGATEPDGALTKLGARMAQVPAHPRLSRLVLEGEKLGLATEAATLAAMLSEGHPERAQNARDNYNELLDLMSDLERYRPVGTALRARDQFLRHCRPRPPERAQGAPELTALNKGVDLRRAVLAGFPDRVAKLRKLSAAVQRNTSGQKAELVFGGGGSALIENSGALTGGAEYFIAVDIAERGSTERSFSDHSAARARVCRSICPINPDWLLDLEPEGVTDADTVEWDEARERVLATSRVVYDGLVLSESKSAADPEKAADKLAQAALAAGIEKFCDPEALASLGSRIRFLREDLKLAEFPDISGEGMKALLREACRGKTSFEEIRGADLLSQILYGFSSEQRDKLERLAPEFAQLAAGRRVRIHYEPGKPPWVESRLQDFFGMRAGPSVGGGRIALVLHLLAPNQRAVQVTADLAGFWERHYPDLRKELGRRYPRHAWPEDPYQVPPPRAPRR